MDIEHSIATHVNTDIEHSIVTPVNTDIEHSTPITPLLAGS